MDASTRAIFVPRKYLMPSVVLTDLTVRTLKSDGAQLDYWCSKTPGFGVRVGKRTKTFMAKVNNRRIGLGAYPAISLQAARRKALALKSDPEAGQATASFKTAYDRFLATHVPTLAPSTQKQIKRILKSHLYPAVKSKQLDKITHSDIANITDALMDTPSEAWHAFKDIRSFFRWCVPRYIPHSPCEGLKSPTKYISRKRVLSLPELKKVWQHATDYPFGVALRLCTLTGARWGEIISLRWSYIDEKKQTITLPETKNGTAHTFPYGGLAKEIFDNLPRLNSTDLLFPGRGGEPWQGSGKSKWEFNKGCKLAPWQIRDLRRSAATHWAEAKVPPHIVERLLNHKLGSLQSEGVITAVASVYNRAQYMDEMRAAIEGWDARLKALLDEPETA
jgi:integrase